MKAISGCFKADLGMYYYYKTDIVMT